ncbi:MAG TPA: winged helix-turn-helix domain-containing protein [Gemmataceae bacterium]|jgi:hypothetical protein|nr:winged helix-turn-helix domain-containing protein [Gemmataceae bacterium]
MSVDASVSPVTRIGETAGVVWRYLDTAGKVPIRKMLADLDQPRDLLMQAIGWLAREDKIELTVVKRQNTIALKR